VNDDSLSWREAPERAPLDATDEHLLQEVAVMLDDLDPMPADLVERVQLALALDEVYEEVARMTRVADDALAVRTDVVGTTRADTLTFSADRLTSMVTVSDLGPGRCRIDGWVSPPGARRVTVRTQGWSDEVLCDDTGRFVVEELPASFVQLVFHPRPDESGGAVVTPLFKA
jgi:hypothetical protein